MNIRSIILITIFFTFSITSPIIGSENYYRTLADLKARPTGMGGAYLAVPSDLSCILYNPATLTQEERLNSHVNVLAFIKIMGKAFKIASLFEEKKEEEVKSQKEIEAGKEGENLEGDEFLLYLVMTVTGAIIGVRGGCVYSLPKFYLGYNVMEDSLANENSYKSSKFFNLEGIKDNHYNSILLGYRITPKSSLGVVWNDYHQEEDNKKIREYGMNFGLFHKFTNRLNIGLVYFDFPDELSNNRIRIERFADETMNLGISYQLNKDDLIAVDVRNLFDSNKSAFQEIHLGLEKQVKGMVALRTGYFQEKESKKKVYSYGLGIILDKKYATKKSPSKYCLNYSIVQEKDKLGQNNFHFFTLVLPL